MKQKMMFALLLGLLLVAIAATATAESRETTRATVYFLVNNWKTKSEIVPEDKLNQSVFGLLANYVPNDRFNLQIDGRLSSSKLKPEDNSIGELKQSSLNDTRIAATYSTPSGVASLTALANLPTGKTKLDFEHYTLSQLVADNSRKYVTRRFGQGLDLGVEGLFHPGSAKVRPFIGGGYLLRGKYQVRETDSEKYKFGDEISGRAGFDYNGVPVYFTADGIVIFYLKDKIGDQEVYQSGPTTIIRAQIGYEQRFSLYGGLLTLMRGKAKVRGEGNEEKLTDEASKSGRNELLIYAGGGYPLNEKLRLTGRLELQSFSENDYQDTDLLHRPKSNYFGIGGGLVFALTPQLYTTGSVTFYSGKVELAPEDLDLSGLGLILALTLRVE